MGSLISTGPFNSICNLINICWLEILRYLKAYGPCFLIKEFLKVAGIREQSNEENEEDLDLNQDFVFGLLNWIAHHTLISKLRYLFYEKFNSLLLYSFRIANGKCLPSKKKMLIVSKFQILYSIDISPRKKSERGKMNEGSSQRSFNRSIKGSFTPDRNPKVKKTDELSYITQIIKTMQKEGVPNFEYRKYQQRSQDIDEKDRKAVTRPILNTTPVKQTEKQSHVKDEEEKMLMFNQINDLVKTIQAINLTETELDLSSATLLVRPDVALLQPNDRAYPTDLEYETIQYSTIGSGFLIKKNKVFTEVKLAKDTVVMILHTKTDIMEFLSENNEKFTKIHNRYYNNFKVKTPQFYLVTEDVFTNAIVKSRGGRLVQCILHPGDCRLMLCIPVTEEEYLGIKEAFRRMKEEC